jgi:CheY-like chemotaxis protein
MPLNFNKKTKSTSKVRQSIILMAEDDPDDVLLTHDALSESGVKAMLKTVKNGEELIDYLRQQHNFNDQDKAPRPDLIFLDLNMPKKDGREALKEIKSDPELKEIPVVILTTSQQEEDIINSYRLGVNSFISKPVSFAELVSTMDTICRYWFETVRLPL